MADPVHPNRSGERDGARGSPQNPTERPNVVRKSGSPLHRFAPFSASKSIGSATNDETSLKLTHKQIGKVRDGCVVTDH
jgi:hypothetical protein